MPAKRITRRQLGGLVGGFAFANAAYAIRKPLYMTHFRLRVSDLDRSVAFYYALFGGLTMEIKGGSHFAPPEMKALSMKIAPGMMYMILSPPDPKTPVGLEHIALDMPGLDIARDNHLPLPFYTEPYTRDPDGNWVEFSGVAGPDWDDAPIAVRLPMPGNPAIKPPIFESISMRRVAIKVSDLERAAEFYRHFGAEVRPANAKAKAFDFQGTTLELAASRNAPGFIGFSVGVRNFNANLARQALHKTGIKPYGKQQDSVVFHDPDGNLVRVFSMDIPV